MLTAQQCLFWCSSCCTSKKEKQDLSSQDLSMKEAPSVCDEGNFIKC